jgi:serine/threonine protein kinase
MWRKKFFDGTELGLSKPFTLTNLQVVHLPRLTVANTILLDSGEQRCSLQPTHRIGHGGHGVLTEYIRNGTYVLLKTSHIEDQSVRIEAFIQWLAHKIFNQLNLGIRIPQVLDIVKLPDNTEGFTMLEYTEAQLASRWILESNSFEKDLYHLLIQVAILLQILEDALNLDHRDLKADNLLILEEPSSLSYICSKNNKRYTVYSPFTVAIVDFGFACLGDEEKFTEIDAGEGTLPPLDPCPKDGRDLFHLLVSLYGMDAFRKLLTPRLVDTFSEWLSVKEKSCESLARRWSHSEWIYLLTSRKEFLHPACTPRAIIEKVFSLDPTLFTSLS